MYIKINGSNKKYYVSLMPFKTQHGNDAIKIIGEVPESAQGFIAYDDNDRVVGNYSDYIYTYNMNSYTTVEEQIETGQCSLTPLPKTPFDIMQSDITRINTKIAEISSYSETKNLYYGEIEKIFYNVPVGKTSLFFSNYTGKYSLKRLGDNLIIKFPKRIREFTTLTVVVQ